MSGKGFLNPVKPFSYIHQPSFTDRSLSLRVHTYLLPKRFERAHEPAPSAAVSIAFCASAPARVWCVRNP